MSDSIAGMLFGVSIIFIPILLFFMVGVGIDCFKPEDWLNNYAENKKILKELGIMLIVLLVLDYIFLIRPAFA